MKVVIASLLAVCIATLGMFALWNRRQQAAEPDARPALAPVRSQLPPGSGQPRMASLIVSRRGSVPDPYRVLLTRCIFSPHRVASAAIDPSATASAAAAASLSNLSLRGISQEDSRYTAYVEDTTTHHIIELRTGDGVATGRVGDISLHDMEYLAGGQSVRIEVGQTLSGTASAPIQAMASADRPAPPPPPVVADPEPPKKKKRRSE